MKAKVLVILTAALAVAALTAMAAWGQETGGKATGEGLKPYIPTRIEWLAADLNAKFKKERDRNAYDADFSITYIPESKNDTIVLYVSHGSKVDREYMRKGIDNARQIIRIKAKSYGWDAWLKLREDLVED